MPVQPPAAIAGDPLKPDAPLDERITYGVCAALCFGCALLIGLAIEGVFD